MPDMTPKGDAAEDQNKNHTPAMPADGVGLWQIFLIFLRLGLTSFGGPVAHIGYFREDFVAHRRWFACRSLL